MRAVLRLWWTYFTAVPLQRGLSWVAGALLALAVVGHFLSGEVFWLPLGYTIFGLLAAFPALFSGPALFRSLSAPRMYQLLPYFRLRMLVAVGLVLGALFVLTAVFIFWLPERPIPLAALHFPLAFLVGMFLVLFLSFGDWRWFMLMPLAAVALVLLQRAGPEAVATLTALTALPAWILSAVALGAWAIFATWYLRVRQVRAIMLMPQQRALGLDPAQPVPRTVAIRALLAAYLPGITSPRRGLASALLVLLGVALFGAAITWALRSLSLTSFIWPLALMLVCGERSTAIVRQSRLLWLKIPGSRDAVRNEIERVLWRNWLKGSAVLAVVAVIAASPLVGEGAVRALLGLAVGAGAALCGTYAAFASVRGIATLFWGVGPLALVQIALLGHPTPSLTAAAAVVAIELAGAVLLRAVTIRRWRTVDWLRLRPLATLAGVPRWM